MYACKALVTTTTEGIGYGLLFAVYNNDKTTFDKLFAYEQAHVNGNGWGGSSVLNPSYIAPSYYTVFASYTGDATATNRPTPFNNFFAGKDITSVVDGYSLDGQATGSKHNGAALGPIASAAAVSGSSSCHSSTWNELISATGGGYCQR